MKIPLTCSEEFLLWCCGLRIWHSELKGLVVPQLIAAMAGIQSLAQELPYAMGVAIKKPKTNKTHPLIGIK